MVHVHFKEEIGVAELIPLVTTYIILFAYIYFSTRESLPISPISVVLAHTRSAGRACACARVPRSFPPEG